MAGISLKFVELKNQVMRKEPGGEREREASVSIPDRTRFQEWAEGKGPRAQVEGLIFDGGRLIITEI